MVLERALRTEPENPHVRAALAFFLRNRGRLDEAQAVLQSTGHAAEEEEHLALLLDLGQLEEAGVLASGRGRTHPSARWYLLRGIGQTMQGREEDAILSFQEAIKNDPRSLEPHHRLAQALRAAGHPREAVPHLNWVENARKLEQLVSGIDYESASPAVMAEAAELCRRMGRDREADAWHSLLAPAGDGALAHQRR
jgi:thioredoxin-like negative regulator of GroEL